LRALEVRSDPTTPPNHSTPLRRVLDRSRLWNARFQASAYQFNLHSRVQRVFTAWQDGQPEYGSIDQMVRDLSEIPSRAEAATVPATIPTHTDHALEEMAVDFRDSDASTQPARTQPAQTLSTDNEAIAAGSAPDEQAIAAEGDLDAQTQRHLQTLLEAFTLQASDDRQTALSQLNGILADISNDASSVEPGKHSHSMHVPPVSD
jgi:hypothetical protein